MVLYLIIRHFCSFLFRVYRILRAEDASGLPSNTSTAIFTPLPTNTQPVASTTSPNVVPLAVGLTVGLLALGIVVLGSIQFLRRRRRIDIDLDAHPDPLHTVYQTMQAGQQPARPRSTKHTPPSILSPTQPTLLSSVTMTTGNSIVSSSRDKLGLPPSYESHGTNGGAGTAE